MSHNNFLRFSYYVNKRIFFVFSWTNRHDWTTTIHPIMHLSQQFQSAQSVSEGCPFFFRAILKTQAVGPPCDDEGALSTMVPAEMSCQSPGGMATDWSPSPPLFLTKVHSSGDWSKCRHQYYSSLFSPPNTVGAQKLTGWFSPKLLFLGVWQQMHYCVLAGYVCRLMYAAQTHWMAFWSVTVK